MRAILALTFAILATPALADSFLKADPRSLTLSGDAVNVSITLTNTSRWNRAVILVTAVLIDTKGHDLQLGRVSGLPSGRPEYNCMVNGSLVAAGAGQVVLLSFKVPAGENLRDETFALSMEFEADEGICTSSSVSLDGLRP